MHHPVGSGVFTPVQPSSQSKFKVPITPKWNSIPACPEPKWKKSGALRILQPGKLGPKELNHWIKTPGQEGGLKPEAPLPPPDPSPQSSVSEICPSLSPQSRGPAIPRKRHLHAKQTGGASTALGVGMPKGLRDPQSKCLKETRNEGEPITLADGSAGSVYHTWSSSWWAVGVGMTHAPSGAALTMCQVSETY